MVIVRAVIPGSAVVTSDCAKADGMARSSAPTSARPASVNLRMKSPLSCRKEARWCARLLLLRYLDNGRTAKVRRRSKLCRVGDGCATREPLADVHRGLPVDERLAGEQRDPFDLPDRDDRVRSPRSERSACDLGL